MMILVIEEANRQWQEAYIEYMRNGSWNSEICMFDHPILPGRFIINTGYI